MKEYKKIHNSWKKRADKELELVHLNLDKSDCYVKGVDDFRLKALEALEIFSVLSNKEVFLYGNQLCVHLEDVKLLIEVLYAETKIRKKK